MPLDAHVLKQARELNLLKKDSATMATARKLTEIMSKVFPGDPLRGDFALFGQGQGKPYQLKCEIRISES